MEELKIKELVGRFGTPMYVYDLSKIRQSVKALRQVIPQPSTLYYSFKANRHPAVVSQICNLGCLAEVSSSGEVEAAHAAGFDMSSAIYTSPGKSISDIEQALRSGVGRFSVDSPSDYQKVVQAARKWKSSIEILLRVNADQPVPGIGLKMTGTSSQMGADITWILSDPKAFRSEPDIPIVGLHLYMGTNIPDTHLLLKQFEISLELVEKARKALGITLKLIDLGGGFGAPYAEDVQKPLFNTLRQPLEALLDRLVEGWRQENPAIIFESGRYITGSCGVFVSRILDIKFSKGKKYIVLDSGIHHLSGLAGLKRVPTIAPQVELIDSTSLSKKEKCTIVGPLCTPLDIWGQNIELPLMSVGDIVIIRNVGAYGLAASLVLFHGHNFPVEVVMDNKHVISVSRLKVERKDESTS